MNLSSVVRYWCAPMFTYGAIRGYRAEQQTALLFSDKLCNSLINGFCYVYPFGIVKLIHVMDRIEVRVTNRNPDDFPYIYQEARGINKNVLL